MEVAETFANLSTAKRLQVGAIVVKHDSIISIGYNGMRTGWTNECEIEVNARELGVKELVTKKEVLHAETNAIAKLAKSSESGEGASLFVTHAPCIDCAKLIYQAGIEAVYYKNDYRSTDGIDFLEKSKIRIIKL